MARKPNHGTHSEYTNHGCRCGACTAAHNATVKKERTDRTSKPTPAYVHGTINGYNNHGCRCGACRDAYNAYRRDRREGS